MNAIIINAATALAGALLGAALVARRPWFRRHVRHWEYAWGVGMALAAVFFGVGLAGAALDVFTGVFEMAPVLLTLAATSMLVFVTLQRAEVVVPTERRILVVAAHPDDLELAAGGTIARFADRGHDVRAIVMSDGAVGGDADERPDEAAHAAEYLGLRDLSLHRYTDTRLGTEMDRMIATIEAEIAAFQPDLILTHSVNDQHQDHHSVHLAVLRAGRRVPTILCFESPSVTPEFQPRFYVDVSDYVDAKVGAVAWHADQLGKPYMGSDRIVGMAAHRGSEAKIQYAEGFEVVRALSSALGDL